MTNDNERTNPHKNLDSLESTSKAADADAKTDSRKANESNLPPLPVRYNMKGGDGDAPELYTSDQMRAYGRECMARAALRADVPREQTEARLTLRERNQIEHLAQLYIESIFPRGVRELNGHTDHALQARTEFWNYLDSLASPAAAKQAEPTREDGLKMKRYAINPDNGYVYESERGPWVRHVDLATPRPEAAPPQGEFVMVREALLLLRDAVVYIRAGMPADDAMMDNAMDAANEAIAAADEAAAKASGFYCGRVDADGNVSCECGKCFAAAPKVAAADEGMNDLDYEPCRFDACPYTLHCQRGECRHPQERASPARAETSAPQEPTPQQISDYLNGLDTIERAIVEREARAETSAPQAAVTFAISVLQDVMVDIRDWEDSALFNACDEAAYKLRASTPPTSAAHADARDAARDKFDAAVRVALNDNNSIEGQERMRKAVLAAFDAALASPDADARSLLRPATKASYPAGPADTSKTPR